MLSRVAENIYWLSRYVERAENTARLVRVNSHLVLDTPSGITPGWKPLVDITVRRNGQVISVNSPSRGRCDARL